MSIFQNSFFSVSGQLERLSNVGNTLVAAAKNVASNLTFGLVKGEEISSNTGIKAVDSVLRYGANNPAVVAGGVSAAIAPAATLSVAKSAATGATNIAKSAFSSLSPLGKVATVVAAPAVISTVASSSQAQKALLNYPSASVNLGKNLAGFIDAPSIESGTNIFKQNPVLSSTLAGAAVLGAGFGFSSLAASALNTAAVRKNTQTTSAKVLDAINISDPSENNDVKLAKIAAENNLAIAKEQTRQYELAAKAQAAAAQAAGVSNVPQTAPINAQSQSQPIISSPKPKKKAKKKAKSRKKVTKKKKTASSKRKKSAKKKKTIKRKSSKRR